MNNYYSFIKIKLTLLVAVLCLCSLFAAGVNGQDDEENTIPDFLEADTEALLSWEAPLELQKEYPYFLSGFDDEDSPIWIVEMGKWDIRKRVEGGPQKEKQYRKYVLQFLTRVKQSVNLRSTNENPVTEFNFLFDMDGYTVRQTSSPAALGITMWMGRQFEQAFRGRLRHGYFVNGNFVFTTVWNLLKPILGPNVYKVEVFGTNKDQWLPKILRNLPRNQLPKWYGGSEEYKPAQVYG